MDGNGISSSLGFGNDETFKETTDEQRENAYNVITYYLNHISELGDLGSIDVKNLSENKDYHIAAEVVASVDVSASKEAKEAFDKGEEYDLVLSSNELEDGALYFLVHESDKRAGTYDVSLSEVSGNSLNMKVKDLSPVTVSKISFNKIALVETNKNETTEIQAVSEEKTDNSSMKIIFIVLAVVALGGLGAFLFFNKRKRRIKAPAHS